MEKKNNKQEHLLDLQWVRRALLLALIDAVIIALSSVIALMARFDFSYAGIMAPYLSNLYHYMPVNIVLTLIVFYFCRMYHSLWKFVGVHELGYMLVANGISFFVQITGMYLLQYSMPRSYHFFQILLQTVLVCGIRFSYRFFRHLREVKDQKFGRGYKWKRVMVIGAGEAGKVIIKEIIDSQLLTMKICCVIDDDRNKVGRYINGVPIVGNRSTILSNVEKYKIDSIILAIPSAPLQEKKDILEICKMSGCELKTLPGVYQLIDGELNVSKLRDVEITDLLGREPIQVNLNEIMGYVKDKVILVT